jgi:hypothetical protein
MSSVLAAVTIILLIEPAFASAAEIKRSLLCESSEAATVGYLNKEFGRSESAMKVSTPLERQKTGSQWRVDPLPSGNDVRVTRYSGTFQQIEAPEVWNLEVDPAGIGWLLVRAQRPAGFSPETITITKATLHFVYSTQHVNPF